MTTYDDDMVRLHLLVGSPTIPLKELGLEWPPPERLAMDPETGVREARDSDDDPLVRVNCSQITDEQRADMTNVFRGAEYRYEKDLS